MLDSPQRRRRETTRAEILEVAWEMCRRDGLAALSLRSLAAAVGMRAPSLYSYFDSKDAIYDAMFRQGQEQAALATADLAAVRPVTRKLFKEGTRAWFEFCVSDPTRYQLLFQRVIPGFEPSPESYELAIRQLDELVGALEAVGVTEPAHVDLYTGLISGLAAQQIANDPGGDRWMRILDDAIDMYLDHVGVPPDEPTERTDP